MDTSWNDRRYQSNELVGNSQWKRHDVREETKRWTKATIRTSRTSGAENSRLIICCRIIYKRWRWSNNTSVGSNHFARNYFLRISLNKKQSVFPSLGISNECDRCRKAWPRSSLNFTRITKFPFMALRTADWVKGSSPCSPLRWRTRATLLMSCLQPNLHLFFLLAKNISFVHRLLVPLHRDRDPPLSECIVY